MPAKGRWDLTRRLEGWLENLVVLKVKYNVSIRIKNLYGGTEVQFYTSNPVPADGDWLISSPGRFIPAGKSSGYPLNKRLREPKFLSGRFGEDIYMLLQSRFEPRSLGFPTSKDYAVPTPELFSTLTATFTPLLTLWRLTTTIVVVTHR